MGAQPLTSQESILRDSVHTGCRANYIVKRLTSSAVPVDDASRFVAAILARVLILQPAASIPSSPLRHGDIVWYDAQGVQESWDSAPVPISAKDGSEDMTSTGGVSVFSTPRSALRRMTTVMARDQPATTPSSSLMRLNRGGACKRSMSREDYRRASTKLHRGRCRHLP